MFFLYKIETTLWRIMGKVNSIFFVYRYIIALKTFLSSKNSNFQCCLSLRLIDLPTTISVDHSKYLRIYYNNIVLRGYCCDYIIHFIFISVEYFFYPRPVGLITRSDTLKNLKKNSRHR